MRILVCPLPSRRLRVFARNDGVGVGCLIFLLLFSACRSHHQSTETLVVAQRQQCQLTVSDTLWQQLTVCFDDLVVEWLTDRASTSIGPKTAVRLTATRAEVGSEQREARAVVTTMQHFDTLSEHHVMESATGIAAPDCIEGARHRWWWLWLLLLALLAIGVGVVRWRMKC